MRYCESFLGGHSIFGLLARIAKIPLCDSRRFFGRGCVVFGARESWVSNLAFYASLCTSDASGGWQHVLLVNKCRETKCPLQQNIHAGVQIRILVSCFVCLGVGSSDAKRHFSVQGVLFPGFSVWIWISMVFVNMLTSFPCFFFFLRFSFPILSAALGRFGEVRSHSDSLLLGSR